MSKKLDEMEYVKTGFFKEVHDELKEIAKDEGFVHIGALIRTIVHKYLKERKGRDRDGENREGSFR
jgi:metal-responsive CopG/Arc/MetJ family transcriptional regulator